MNIEQLVSAGSGRVFRYAATDTPIRTFRFPETRQKQVNDTISVVDKASLLCETSAAMRFPDYFVHNRDAFCDCLSDSAEPVAQGLIVVFNDQ